MSTRSLFAVLYVLGCASAVIERGGEQRMLRGDAEVMKSVDDDIKCPHDYLQGNGPKHLPKCAKCVATCFKRGCDKHGDGCEELHHKKPGRPCRDFERFCDPVDYCRSIEEAECGNDESGMHCRGWDSTYGRCLHEDEDTAAEVEAKAEAEAAAIANDQKERDDCGTCTDCAGTVNGDAVEDACGVCGGDDSTCTDCAGTVNGDAVEDACGVCGGDDSSCTDDGLQIVAGGQHTCAIDKATRHAVCWGDNYSDQSTPPEDVEFASLAAGGSHNCGIVKDTHKAECWGLNQDDQSTPPEDVEFASGSLVAGWEHTCGIVKDTHKAECWGEGWTAWHKRDYYSVYSEGEYNPPDDVEFTSLTAGAQNCCGIVKDTHKAFCWGIDYDGESSPPNDVEFASLAGGRRHTCGVVKDTHKVTCWGDDRDGQASPPNDVEFASLAAGSYHTCGVVKDTHKAICWGENEYLQASPPNDVEFASLAAGSYHTCGIVKGTDGVVCWGVGINSDSDYYENGQALAPADFVVGL